VNEIATQTTGAIGCLAARHNPHMFSSSAISKTLLRLHEVMGSDGLLARRRVRDHLNVGGVDARGARTHVLRPRVLGGEDSI